MNDVDINNEDDRDTVKKFFINNMPKFEKAIQEPLIRAKAVIE